MGMIFCKILRHKSFAGIQAYHARQTMHFLIAINTSFPYFQYFII
ncbi:hypothetical protein HMPREF0083_04520 [Aneurinibacillus aneurinilyticus ATCC 12856]|jgi:hypothetical protein|uniref:Uncharacterized protein n=1 Tax=Aneurinibacillus aneurinilyticus ATCC 12856 TaxID=649747 RepID=U1WFT3_ANEAE|nr:hypothetical protein HMPREF0083_04520 [Aneurinibacillus aneurinilyticus ATCC 12856]